MSMSMSNPKLSWLASLALLSILLDHGLLSQNSQNSEHLIDDYLEPLIHHMLTVTFVSFAFAFVDVDVD